MFRRPFVSAGKKERKQRRGGGESKTPKPQKECLLGCNTLSPDRSVGVQKI